MKTKIILLLTMIIGSFILNSLIPIFILWLGYAFFIDLQNDHILSHRIIILFHLPNSFSLIVITSILGGIIGGLASWSGYNLKMAFHKI